MDSTFRVALGALLAIALTFSAHAAQLAWAADPWATGYNVYSNGVKVATTINRTYDIPASINSTTLWWVTSFDALSESDPSNKLLFVFAWIPL